MEGGAYGAGKAGGAFDPHTLVRQPHTILRVVSWVRTAGWPGRAGGGVSWGLEQGRRARTDANPAGPRAKVPQPAGSFPAGCRRSPLPPSRAPEGGLSSGEGLPLLPTAPLRPGAPIRLRPPIAVTSRPQLCSWRLGVRAAARADQRRWGLSPGFRWPFWWGGSGRGSSHGVHAAPAADVQGGEGRKPGLMA